MYKKIGEPRMVEIIAEFCQNHNGDEKILDEMIHAAADGGATYGKIQTIFVDELSYRPEFEEGKIDADGNTLVIKRPYKAEYERLKGLELTLEQQARFIEKCKKFGLKPLTTCFSRGKVDAIAKLGFKEIKVASYDCGSLPLLTDLAKKFDKIIISTGATYDDEIEKAAALLKESGKEFSFLHCVTIYPTPLEQIHLNRMNYLKKFSTKVGLSEHTLVSRDGIKASAAAIYLGAEYVERHFTILKPTETKDGQVSITLEHLKKLVEFSKLSRSDQKLYLNENVPEFAIMQGNESRELSKVELLNRAYFRGRFSTITNEKTVYNWEEGENLK
jgi:N,N'-diacetyllegionaminate synthase